MTLPSWLQNYVERHTASVINDQVEKRSQSSEFLQTTNPAKVALFQQREIQKGSLLGSGNFSDVYEVSKFKLLRSGRSPWVEDARLTCCWNAKRTHKYAIKLPKRPGRSELIGSSRRSRKSSRQDGSSTATNKFPEYTKAAIDLIIEGKFLSALDHKHIVKVRGLSAGPSPFIIMDRLDDTLDNRIAQWRQQENSTVALKQKATHALQMAEAVKYLHDKRIIVRDIKPANVGFKKDVHGQDMVQLFDFGLCRELPQSSHGDQEDTFRMSVAGTLRYMAVEICNTGFYGLKADVYSWAVVCFEMLTLEVPFANLCASPAMYKRFVCREGERPSFPEEGTKVPLPLQELIRNSWAQETRDRLDMSSVCVQLRTLIETDFGTKTLERPNRIRAVKSLPVALTGPIAPLLVRTSLSASPPRGTKRPSLASSNFPEPMRSATPPFLV